MPLSAGAKLGPYEIVSAIGKGGMGEVWRARDPRVGRDVAIKISAQQFSDRFEREARAIAALNHPNICTLFDVGPNYLVMELVEGSTLAERIAQGPIPLEEALAIAKQIAGALETAHEKGFVHRDLKPANIMIRDDGSVKVLDFGLAKFGAEAGLASDSPATLSVAGTILGTAGYMAPEQARGKEVDKRADIWAWGVVLYELLTGERLFKGENVPDTLAQVLTKQPDLNRVPATARRLLQECLQKDPKLRLRDIGDAKQLLSEDPAPARSPAVPWLITGLAVAVATVLALVYFRQKPPQQQIVRFEIPAPEMANIESFKLSPDGRYLAIAAANRLWIRALDSFELRSLAGTEGASYPFWSPGSDFIGFFTQGKLKKIDVAAI
jgi:serine/threonine protein kinase